MVRALAADPNRHLLLVTATPHSGKDAAFRNLIGLLDPALHDLDLDQTKGRELLARHLVQRRRADIARHRRCRRDPAGRGARCGGRP